MKRDINLEVPKDLQEAEALLECYGRWAQDRYKKQRCASAEGKYQPPPGVRSRDEPPVQSFIPDWSAMQVQHALQVVPMQFRRVLFAIYVPQKEHPMAVRRRLRLKSEAWESTRVMGLRQFWSIYSCRYLRRLTKSGTIAPILRDNESCAPVTSR